MTRRTAAEPGIRAFFDGVCPACDQPIIRNQSRIVAQRGEWRHTHCMPGADDA